MGSVLNKPQESKVLVVGFDYAGKKTILRSKTINDKSTVINPWPPSAHMGIVKKIQVTNQRKQQISFITFDIGGVSKIRPLWHQFFPKTQAIIVVVDSTDSERFNQNDLQSDLKYILDNQEMKKSIKAMLILCNKRDSSQSCSNIMSIESIAQGLNVCKVIVSEKHKKSEFEVIYRAIMVMSTSGDVDCKNSNMIAIDNITSATKTVPASNIISNQRKNKFLLTSLNIPKVIVEMIFDYILSDKKVVDEIDILYRIQGCCAIAEDGLYQGFEWLYDVFQFPNKIKRKSCFGDFDSISTTFITNCIVEK